MPDPLEPDIRAAADLLYSGPWVAERLAAIQPFVDSHADQMNPVVAQIIAGARRYTAVDTFTAEYRLRELRRAAEAIIPLFTNA